MTKLTKLSGVYTVLPTPFDDKGKVDRESLRNVIELFLGDGVSGFTALGVTSEVAHLVEMNHSRAFWRLVARLYPNVPRAKAWLDHHGPELHRYGLAHRATR